MHSHVDDMVLDKAILPAGRRIERWFSWCKKFQQGMAQHYLLYILIAVILLLCSLLPYEKIIKAIFFK